MTENCLQKSAIIVNPTAGRKRRRRKMTHFFKWLQSEYPQLKIVKTQYAGHASEITKDLLSNGYNTIIAAGGDGTLNEIAREMIHHPANLGIMPAGSGNGLARHLGIPNNPFKAWDIIQKNHVVAIDSAMLNDIPFFSIAGTGFDAMVASEFAQMNGRGFINYLRATIKLYFKYKPRKYKVILNNEVYACKALFISFANSNQFGYNTSIAPSADLSDGMLDVCIMQKVPVGNTPLVAPKLFTKRLDRSRYLHIIQSSSVRILRKKPGFIHIDGDPQMLHEKEIRLNVLPSSINILAP